ncbi:MAG: four helix bundle protein [Planctomycetes bacterium]|nr:four helix bundle protein [Planctomycetota bacterium]
MGFNFEDLDVYRKAIDLVAGVYSVTKDFPKDEMFGLTSQLRRAAVAIPANISEGSARTKKDFCRFINMARGSLFECVTLLRISRKQSYIDQKQFVDLSKELTDLSKMLSGLKRSISPQTMNNEHPTTNAFTLVELMVAVGILAIVLSFAGVIFNASIDTHRIALANAEIMQKLRAITGQLDADFQGLRKDGEIFVTWVAAGPGRVGDCDLDGYERFDRIMFFADGDFQSYQAAPMIRGNTARICYMLARKGPVKAEAQPKAERTLARTQHILTPGLPRFDPASFTSDADWDLWNNRYEYDNTSLAEWKHIPLADKQNMLAVITDVNVASPTVGMDVRGANVDTADPGTIHMLLCEGVGEFKVQGWSYDPVRRVWRWIPEVDIDGPGPLKDTDFRVHPHVPGVLYPYRLAPPGVPYGGVNINKIGMRFIAWRFLNEANFNNIPGLGRALKFTFTLFDSKGIIKQGRTFTHIVYLDK